MSNLKQQLAVKEAAFEAAGKKLGTHAKIVFACKLAAGNPITVKELADIVGAAPTTVGQYCTNKYAAYSKLLGKPGESTLAECLGALERAGNNVTYPSTSKREAVTLDDLLEFDLFDEENPENPENPEEPETV